MAGTGARCGGIAGQGVEGCGAECIIHASGANGAAPCGVAEVPAAWDEAAAEEGVRGPPRLRCLLICLLSCLLACLLAYLSA